MLFFPERGLVWIVPYWQGKRRQAVARAIGSDTYIILYVDVR